MIIICYRCCETNSCKLYPWIHQFSNNKRSADQIQAIYFPDVDPHSLPPGANFSMTAGDFREIYSESSKWGGAGTRFGKWNLSNSQKQGNIR